MLALVDWPAEAAAAQELIARAAAEAAEAAAAAANEDGPPDLEAAPTVHAPPSREGAPFCKRMAVFPSCGSLVLVSCRMRSLASSWNACLKRAFLDSACLCPCRNSHMLLALLDLE